MTTEVYLRIFLILSMLVVNVLCLHYLTCFGFSMIEEKFTDGRYDIGIFVSIYYEFSLSLAA